MTVRLDLVRTATGSTRAVADRREFTSTVTTARRLSLTLGNDGKSGPDERPPVVGTRRVTVLSQACARVNHGSRPAIYSDECR
ncbi:hypothetical protein [Streptomyces sp. NPDC058398]|uniref:hypothetical protein n=1 Tax=Streptomyces sp. NPDC058398 TaxID=3346479 RepID=UPI003661BDA6